MKPFFYLFLLLLAVASCTSSSTEIVTKDKTDSTRQKYYTTLDTVIISFDEYDTFRMSKKEFNEPVDNHEELYAEFPENPDITYHSNPDWEYGSEAGQDAYYMLYAYFLKQRNGIDGFATQRKKLIDIFTRLNSLYQKFQYGGSYFGHMHRRIEGYAEYSIYIMPKSDAFLEKTYDITPQKKLYIQSLRQLIADESSVDRESYGEEKIERYKEIHKIVDELDSLITDKFYLNEAQDFQYSAYAYY